MCNFSASSNVIKHIECPIHHNSTLHYIATDMDSFNHKGHMTLFLGGSKITADGDF